MGLKDPCILIMNKRKIKFLKPYWDTFMDVSNCKIILISSKEKNIGVIRLHPNYIDSPNAEYPL